MLSEPFFTPEECNNLNWPDDNKSVMGDEIWDNGDVRSILRKIYPYIPCACLICTNFLKHISEITDQR
jgi:hypothetical protein